MESRAHCLDSLDFTERRKWIDDEEAGWQISELNDHSPVYTSVYSLVPMARCSVGGQGWEKNGKLLQQMANREMRRIRLYDSAQQWKDDKGTFQKSNYGNWEKVRIKW